MVSAYTVHVTHCNLLCTEMLCNTTVHLFHLRNKHSTGQKDGISMIINHLICITASIINIATNSYGTSTNLHDYIIGLKVYKYIKRYILKLEAKHGTETICCMGLYGTLHTWPWDHLFGCQARQPGERPMLQGVEKIKHSQRHNQ